MKRFMRRRNKPFSTRDSVRHLVLKRKKSFLQRHRHIISLVGGVIVFLTFVTKEAIRDQLKDLVDSINSAELIYELGSEIGQVERNVQTLSSRENLAHDDNQVPYLPRFQQSEDSREFVTKALSESHVELSTLRTNIEHGGELAYRSDQKRFEEFYEGLAKQLSELNRRYFPQDSLEFDPLHPQDGGIIDAPHPPESDEQTLAALNNRLQWIEREAIPLIGQTVLGAGWYRQRYELFYRVSTWISYVLYTFGWGLTFSSRLSGSEDLIKGE